MSIPKNLKIHPVTRIEGHGKVVVELDAQGGAQDAYLQVVEFRGFEKFCEGRMLWDLPTITSRICGFCPVSHHLASVKATEAVLGVEPPAAAERLRELLHMGQFIQSHALHFFFCALPDFIGKELTPAQRSVFGLLESSKKLAGEAIALRKVGQDIVDCVGGGRLHPVACIPGGMSKGIDFADRVRLFQAVTKGTTHAQAAVALIKDMFAKNREHFMSFASFPSLYMGLVDAQGALALYDGKVRISDEKGRPLQEFAPAEYRSHVEERGSTRSWLKSVYFKDLGPKNGMYRVAPLARLNVAQTITTPLAAAEHKEFRQIAAGEAISGSLFYHYARMIELLYAMERARELLRDAELMSGEFRVRVERRGGEGVGAVEAPRGTLFHHYWADDDGRVTKVNLLVSTAHNAEAMNRSVLSVAKRIVRNGSIAEDDLSQLEVAVRCYDPCLSCSTHAFGRMPIEVVLVDATGSELATYRYGALDR